MADMPGHSKSLNPRQQKFAQFVALGNMHTTDAARQAGYKDSPFLGITASRIAKQPIVANEISRLQQQLRASLTITAESWLKELTEIYSDAKSEQDRTSALRALELAGKHLGLLEPKRDDGSSRAAEVLATLALLMKPKDTLGETPVLEARVVVEDTP